MEQAFFLVNDGQLVYELAMISRRYNQVASTALHWGGQTDIVNCIMNSYIISAAAVKHTIKEFRNELGRCPEPFNDHAETFFRLRSRIYRDARLLAALEALCRKKAAIWFEKILQEPMVVWGDV